MSKIDECRGLRRFGWLHDAHERACELVAAGSPRLRRVRGHWLTLGADGVWRRA